MTIVGSRHAKQTQKIGHARVGGSKLKDDTIWRVHLLLVCTLDGGALCGIGCKPFKTSGRLLRPKHQQALPTSVLDGANVKQRPRLLSDAGASYFATELSDWLSGKDIKSVRGAPYHPMTQGKIERWHQTLKTRILLENYYLPGDL